MAWHVTSQYATYSASIVEIAVSVHLTLFQETTPHAIINT